MTFGGSLHNSNFLLEEKTLSTKNFLNSWQSALPCKKLNIQNDIGKGLIRQTTGAVVCKPVL